MSLDSSDNQRKPEWKHVLKKATGLGVVRKASIRPEESSKVTCTQQALAENEAVLPKYVHTQNTIVLTTLTGLQGWHREVGPTGHFFLPFLPFSLFFFSSLYGSRRLSPSASIKVTIYVPA